MTIKLALMGDDHVNCPGRTEEARRVHEAMLAEWTQRGVHFIGFAGDWNEVPPNEQDQAWSRDFLGRCANVAPCIVEYGNHDGPGVLDEFHLQSEFKYPITVVSRPDVIRVETEAGPIAVACVPFVWKAHLLAKTGPLSPEESDRIAEAELTNIFRGLGARAREMNIPTVALIHGKWRGSRLNEEQPARPLGMEMAVEDIGMLGAQASCVGHIHLHQSTNYNGMPIFTPSSPYYVDFGEAKHKKGWIYAEAPIDRSQPATWEHIQNPVAPMILVECQWEQGMFVRGGVQLHEADIDAQGADIRLRFHYSKAEEKTAKSAAAEVEKQLLAAGAIKVKLDPVPVPAQTTRALAIVKATTLTEKARLLWAAREINLTQSEIDICLAMIEEVETECGFGKRIALDAGIHVKSTRMRGWRCFPNEVSIDFDAIDGDVIAVCGPNGTGKSLFWEIAIPGSIYRELPTHGRIGDHAIARDTFVETTFEYDSITYTVSQIIDGKDGAGSTSLKRGTTPVFGTETALRTEYDKWAISNLPPLTLVKSTTFMPQESKGILGMGTKDRKALILRAKGAERYEVLAEAAGKRSAEADKAVIQARARIAELGAPGGVGTLQDRVLRLTDEGRIVAEVLRLGETTIADLRGKNEAGHAAWAEYEVAVRQRQSVLDEKARLESEIDLLTARIAKNEGLISESDAITRAVADTGTLTVDLTEALKAEAALRVTQSEVSSEWKQARGREEALREKLNALQRTTANADLVLVDRGVIVQAIADLSSAEDALRLTNEGMEAAWKDIEDAQDRATRGSDGRIGFLRGELWYIAAGNAADEQSYAGSALSADDLVARDLLSLPEQIEALKKAWLARGTANKQASDKVEGVRQMAARFREIEAAEIMKAEAVAQITDVEVLLTAEAVTVADLAERMTAVARDLSTTSGTVAASQRMIDALVPLVAKADPLKDVQTRIQGYEEQKTALARRLAETTVPDIPEAPPAIIDLAPYEHEIASARRSVSENATALALAQRELAIAVEKEERRGALVLEVKALEKTIDRWNLVERTLGRDGLQAEDIAAAGDEINERANELLRSSGNTKYTVDLKTTKLTKDGKKVIEGCPINVYNSETGEWQEGSTLSPGQRAFVNLPIALTLAELGCKDSTVKPTIYMDEPTAGLDPIMRIQFVAMMRDVAKNLDATIFFVTHNQELMEMSDARMAINNGVVTVS